MRRKMSGLIAIRRIRQIVMVVLTLFLAGNFTYADAQSKPEVRLVLQITIDGLRADLINRYENGFSKGGFRLLIKKGAYFTNAHYQHANTETIAGHTTLATGTFPSQHGMVGNVWFDREAGELAYNIEDPDHPLIPTREDESQGEQVDPAQKKSRTQGRSPAAILVPTFGDGLAAYYGGRSKIFGVSGKDRSAVAMAGHVGKAFWYSANTGDFVTSTYYYDAATYLLAAQDDRPYEVDLRVYGRIFPHPFGQADDKLFFTRILVSPIGDQLTLDFYKTRITHEQLGQDEIPDYLSISFSAVDAVNHFFGPSSLENEDVVVQLDRTLADLFAFIDKTVGLKHTLIVLSADHGMADMPEYMTELGYKAGRLDPEQIAAAANKVGQKFGVDEIVRFFYRPYLYLNVEKIAAAKLDRTKVERAIADALTDFDGIALAGASSRLSAQQTNPLLAEVRNNHHVSRSGDIYIIQEPYWFLFDKGPVTAMHGSPWRYDTHVPIIFMGPGILPETVHRRVHPVDVAPTLAALLGMTPPGSALGSPLEEVFK
jgi:predicted AlkP superfamily pyrophosphatase or phosphodiesterase